MGKLSNPLLFIPCNDLVIHIIILNMSGYPTVVSYLELVEPHVEILLVQRVQGPVSPGHGKDVLAEGAAGQPDVFDELPAGSGLLEALPEALPSRQQNWNTERLS
jgi:hypothetical protein